MNPPIDFEKRTESCAKHGEFTSAHTIIGTFDFWSKCPECGNEERLRREEECQQEQRAAWIQRLVTEARIPPRFRGKGFSDYDADCAGERAALSVARNYAEKFKEHLNAGRCLAFCGKPGTGKTHLGCAVSDVVARSGKTVRYVTVLEFFRLRRSPWNSNSLRTEESILQSLATLDLLVIDEIGVQFGTENETTLLTELIGLRYDQLKPTLIISNCLASELGKYLGDRGFDRLRENGGRVVIFDWESHRGKNAN